MRLNNNAFDKQIKSIKMHGKTFLKSHMFQKNLYCSRYDKLINHLKYKLKGKVACRSIDDKLNNLKKDYTNKKNVVNSSLNREIRKNGQYISKKGNIQNIEQTKKKQQEENKRKKENIDCSSNLCCLKKQDITQTDWRVDGNNTSRFLQCKSKADMKKAFFYGSEKLYAFNTAKKKVGEKKDIFDKTCPVIKEEYHKKLYSSDKKTCPVKREEDNKKLYSSDEKICPVVKKKENKKGYSSDKICPVVKKNGHKKGYSSDKTFPVIVEEDHKKDECNTNSNRKKFGLKFKNNISNTEKKKSINNKDCDEIIDYNDKSIRKSHMVFEKLYNDVLLGKGRSENVKEEKVIKGVNVVKGRMVDVARSRSIDYSFKWKRVNEEGIPVPFTGFPHHDDIRVCGFIYCPSNASSLVLTTSGIADLSPLIKLVNLKRLVLPGCRGLDYSSLSNLVSLVYLDLSNSSIPDLKFLSGNVNLRVFNCEGNKVTDISPLARLVNLEYLNLRNCPVEDISPLSGLSKLACLILGQTRIVGIDILFKNKKMKSLDLSSTVVSDIFSLRYLSELEELSLADCPDVCTLKNIANLDKITYLDLSWRDIVDIKVISSFNLMFLDLSSTNIKIEHLNTLSMGPVRESLEILYLNSCNYLTRLYPLADFRKLSELSLSFSQIEYFTEIKEAYFLTKLSLNGINRIENIKFLKGFRNLVWLDLSECISLESIKTVLNLPFLEYLNLSKCPKLFSDKNKTQETLSDLHYVNNLKKVDISYNNIDPADIKKMEDDFFVVDDPLTVICNEY